LKWEGNPLSINYATFEWGNYIIYLAATAEGLCFISAGKDGETELKAWHQKYFKNRTLKEGDAALNEYKDEIAHYLTGKKEIFQSQVQLYGTEFQRKVWNELRNIPFGETRSYTDIATTIGRPKAVRAVANAIGNNPLLFIVPCHRVIRKDGSLSGFRAGTELKEKLLQLEKIQ